MWYKVKCHKVNKNDSLLFFNAGSCCFTVNYLPNKKCKYFWGIHSFNSLIKSQMRIVLHFAGLALVRFYESYKLYKNIFFPVMIYSQKMKYKRGAHWKKLWLLTIQTASFQHQLHSHLTWFITDGHSKVFFTLFSKLPYENHTTIKDRINCVPMVVFPQVLIMAQWSQEWSVRGNPSMTSGGTQ